MENINIITGFILIGLCLTTIGALYKGWRWHAYLPIAFFLLYSIIWIITIGAVFGSFLSPESTVFICGVFNSLFGLVSLLYSFTIFGLQPTEKNKHKILLIYDKIISPVNKFGVLYFYGISIVIWVSFCILLGFLGVDASKNISNFLFIPSAIISFLVLRIFGSNTLKRPIFSNNNSSAKVISGTIFNDKYLEATAIFCGLTGILSGYLCIIFGKYFSYLFIPGLFFGISFSAINIQGFNRKLVFIMMSTIICAVSTSLIGYSAMDTWVVNPASGLIFGAIAALVLSELFFETTELKRKYIIFLNASVVGGTLGAFLVILFNNFSTIKVVAGFAIWQSFVGLAIVDDRFPFKLAKTFFHTWSAGREQQKVVSSIEIGD